jgi:hypothetical protein
MEAVIVRLSQRERVSPKATGVGMRRFKVGAKIPLSNPLIRLLCSHLLPMGEDSRTILA